MPWHEAPARSRTRRASENARALRRSQTEPERRLWWHLRHRLPIEGSHFRRQVAIDGYVVDFCCLRHRLVIEIDGGQHGLSAQAAYDANRTAVLNRHGFHVLRFTNAEVMRAMDGVLDTIQAALGVPSGTTPTPDPSPQGGGEQER